MKRIKSIIAVFIALASMLACFSACNNDSDTDGDGGEETGAQLDISQYSIVYSQRASSELQGFIRVFKDKIEHYTQASLPVSDDWYDEGEDVENKKEILIGETDRAASASAHEELDAIDNSKAYVIKETGNKIVITGKSDAVVLRAMKKFLNSFVKTSAKEGTVTLEKGFSAIGKADTSTLMMNNFVELDISKKFNIYSDAKDTSGSSTITYPKLVQLSHQKNEADNGTLLATFNSGEIFYRIMKSTDNGETWKQVAQVQDKYNRDLQGGRMPMLYELPVDMGEYKKGTILLAGTSSPIGGSSANYEKTAITLYASTDIGKTWTDLPSIDYGAGKIDGNGIWEPFLIYEEETGRLYCFYSDATEDAVEGQHDQKLVYKYTSDLKTWVGKDGKTGQTDDPFEAVACNNPNYRPGMISIAKMGNGEYIMTYEMVGLSWNPTHAKRTTRLDDWGDISDYGTEVKSVDGHSFGSSPWITWSPVGGECGTLVVAGKHWVQNTMDQKSAPSIFLSFDYGKTYIELENPIGYTINKDNRSGYSPCVMFSADGKTLYYATNPNKLINPNQAYISMVRIDIIE